MGNLTKTMKLHNLTEIGEWILKNSNGDFVEANKQMTRIIKQARANAKGATCLYCGRPVTSFCNSHNIPAFCLRNIDSNGMVLTVNSIIEFPFYFKEDSGVGNAGTFHIICEDCDNTIFQEYESPDAYNDKPSHKILAAIALKSNLKYIYKRKVEIEQYKLMQKIKDSPHFNQINEVNALDLKDFLMDFGKAKKQVNSNYNDGYYLVYYDLLNYTVPIAFQGQIALYVDFDGNIVNDIYNKAPNYHVKSLYLCIFPLENKTVIILFIDNNEKRYRKFYKKFNTLSREEKLSVINYLVFLYSEDFYCSEALKQVLKSDRTVKEITGKTTMADISIDDIMTGNVDEQLRSEYNLNEHKNFTNFLSEKYRIKEQPK